MTHLLDDATTRDELFIPGGLAPSDLSLRERLARAEEARADERARRLEAEATAERLAELIAREHAAIAEERTARERAEAACAKAERTAREIAAVAARENERAEQAVDHARQAFTAYLDDPFRAPQAPAGARSKLLRRR